MKTGGALLVAAFVLSFAGGCFTHHVRVEPIEMTVDVHLHGDDDPERDSTEREPARPRAK